MIFPTEPTAQVTPPLYGNGIHCRRLSLRHPCNLHTVCQRAATTGFEEAQWPTRIIDISAGGIGLLVVRRFELGTSLAVEIPPCDNYPGDTLLVRIVHVKLMPGEGWRIGCSFIRSPDEFIVQRLIGLQQRTSPSEKNANREPHAETVVTNDLRSTQNEAEPVVIPRVRWLNAETGTSRITRRLVLKGPWPMPPQTVLKMWVERKTGEQDFTKIVVHSCVKQSEEWVVNYSILGEAAMNLLPWLQND